MAEGSPGSILSSIVYMIGALNFLLGSIATLPQYYISPIYQYISGVSFTIGSTCFCLSNLILLQIHLKLKLFYFDKILSIVGTLLFVAGSIVFIPGVMQEEVVGDYLFIGGLMVMFGNKFWLFWRTGYRFTKMEFVSIMVEILGEVCFVVGIVLSLLEKDVPGVVLYIAGSCFFILCSMFSIITRVKKIKVAREDKEIGKSMIDCSTDQG